MGCADRLVVGIFSREDSASYEWLTRIVTCTSGVKDVRPVLITNTWSDFQREVPKCSFGILYHSQSRGRLNIANVTDSLYDEELQYLAAKYGKDNVIVVVGDVQDSSDEKKRSILREQRLYNYSRDLFLFNEIKGDHAPFQGQKLKELEECIKGRAHTDLCRNWFLWLILAAGVSVIVIIVVIVRVANPPAGLSTSAPPLNVTNITMHFISTTVTTPLSNSTANTTSKGDATKSPQDSKTDGGTTPGSPKD